jgi:hypothetical protein
VARSNCRFNSDANTGHAFGIFMASVGALRPNGLRRQLTWALASTNSQPSAEPQRCRMAVHEQIGYSPRMAPTVVRDGPFRLFFFSREEPRIHVHVAHPDGEAKFWLTPSVHVATATGLSSRQLNDAQSVVEAHLKEIEDAWNHHFGS